MSRFYVFHNAKKVITAKVWQNSVFSCALVILFRFCVVFRFFAAGAVSALHFPVQHQAHHGAQRKGGSQQQRVAIARSLVNEPGKAFCS